MEKIRGSPGIQNDRTYVFLLPVIGKCFAYPFLRIIMQARIVLFEQSVFEEERFPLIHRFPERPGFRKLPEEQFHPGKFRKVSAYFRVFLPKVQ